MNIEELRLKMLKVVKHVNFDAASGHQELDELLLEYIDDIEVTKIFNESPRWYS